MFFKHFVVILSVVALLLPAGLPLTLGAQSSPTVVINELLWMGSPASSADEWIELRNPSDQLVDVSGWKLTRKSSGQEVTMLTVPVGKTIDPREYFLISNFAASSTSTQLNVEPDVVDTAVSLLNSGLEVKLYDANGVLMDVADDGSGTPLAGKYVSNETYASMARNGIPGDGSKPERWHASTTSMNLKTDSIVKGTPRVANDNVPPVVPTLGNQQTAAGATVTFDASDAYDPDGDALQFAWNFGDGGSSEAMAPTHVYVAPGIYAGSLEVRDGVGSVNVTFAVTVAAPTPAPEPVPAAGSTASSTGSVKISELFPNPDGADDSEFIEFVVSGGDVDLSGWSVSDESGATYKFPSGRKMVNGAFLALKREQSKIALNNDGDTVRLKNASAVVVNEVTYGDAEENAGYAWDGTGWAWTTKPTSGSANEIVKPNHPPEAKLSIGKMRRVGEPAMFDASDSTDADGDVLSFVWDFGDGKTGQGRSVKHVYENEGKMVVQLSVRDAAGLEDSATREFTIRPPVKSSSGSKKSASKTGAVKGAATVRTITDAQNANSSTIATLQGWVTAPPNLLGDGVMYISDGTSGIAVRANEPLPKLGIGDGMKVVGKRRTKNSEPYVLVENSAGIVKNEGARILEPQAISAGSIENDNLGSLVTITGEVTTLSGSRFVIDDGSGELAVYVRASTGFKRPAMRSGDRVKVAGILSRTSSGIRLLPRTKDDLEVVSHVVEPRPQTVSITQKPRPSVWAYIVVVFGVVVGAAVGLWRKHRLSGMTPMR